MDKSQEAALNAIAQKIYDRKGFNILALDLQGVSNLYDSLIIAEGSVERHVQALSREVIKTLEELHLPLFHVDGKSSGGWIVIDCGEFVVHLFISELREKYALEQLWREGHIIDLKIKLDNKGSQ